VNSKRLSEDLKTGPGPVIVATNVGGVDETPAVDETNRASSPKNTSMTPTRRQ
jgi:hypothetical protein